MAEQNNDRSYSDSALYRRLFAEMRPMSRHLLGVSLLGLVAAPLALLVPVPLKIVLDSALGGKPLPSAVAPMVPSSWAQDPRALLLAAASAVVVLSALLHVRNAAYHVYTKWVEKRLTLRVRARLFDHMQRLSLGHHQETSLSDALYRLQVDVTCVESVIRAIGPLLGLVVQVVLIVIVMAYIDPTLLWIACLSGLITVGCIELCRRILRRRWAEAHSAESSALGVVGESIGAIGVVKSFGLEERQGRDFRQRGEHAVAAAVSAAKGQSSFDLLSGVVSAIGAAAILYVGGTHVLDGKMTVGSLVLVLTYLFQVYRPARELGTQMAYLQSALASAARVFEVLDREPAVADRPGTRTMQRAKGAFSIERVTFGYGRGPAVLRDVALEIPAGSRVGIAGRTGSGKSTLLSLLPRFYDPQDGVVRLDGIDVRDIKIADLRRQFAIVPQDDVLFSGTVRENIAVGWADASDEQIEQAARAAAAHEFVVALPDGYDTRVGERGLSLSGGERQRISLARAFLRDAPILILDEPTSALDLETERLVLGAIERLMKGRTTFIIAHRMSSLVTADIRLVVDGGQVQQRDTQLDEVMFG